MGRTSGDPEAFPVVLRRHRMAARLTQEQLAERAGLSARSVSQLERGRVRHPRPESVRLLGLALGLSAAERERFGELARRTYWADRSEQPPPGPVPAQLPGDVASFTGRRAELAELDALVDSAATAVVISAVSGTAGVGKTALAVHWAHRVAHRFTDGQLYVNLREFDPGGQVMAPAEAVRGFLDGLGVPPRQIPPGFDAQAALYRSLLAGKRVLVVLDNARDAEQVRPLLPGAPTALVVVTSRNQLTSLVAADGAHPIALDTLPDGEAHELLARRLGEERVAAEPVAVWEMVTACARLPLALTIVAARAQQTSFPLAALAAELGQAGRRLDALDVGDTATDVRAVLSWSYATLSRPAGRLFRLLGLHPGRDIGTPAAAGLAGRSVPATRRLLAELNRANLLVERLPGRYTCHDLLRAYAAELTRTHDTERTRQAALSRLLDHYTHTAYAADRLLNPAREPITVPLGPPAPGAGPEEPADSLAAMTWFTTEHPVLLAVLRHAGATGFDRHAWQLAWAADTFLNRRGHRRDRATAGEIARHAAHHLGDPAAQAEAYRVLGRANIELGRYDEAHAELGRGLNLYVRTGDRLGQARLHHNLASLWERQDHAGRALDHAQQALTLYREAGHPGGQATLLNAVGWYHALLGDHHRALAHCEQALTLLQQLGNRPAHAGTWDSLGYAHDRLGDHARAIDCYQHALTLFRDVGDRSGEGETLARLGDAHEAAGCPDDARQAWLRALDILNDLGHPDAEAVHGKIDAGPRPRGRSRSAPV